MERVGWTLIGGALVSRSRIRILQVITWMDVGGAQEHLLALARGLPADRFEVAVAVGENEGERGELFGSLPPGVEVIELRNLSRSVRPTHDVMAVRELRGLIRSLDPDVIHTHSSKAGVIGRWAARGLGSRVVHNVHGWSFSALGGAPRQAVVALERQLAKRTDVLLMVSQADFVEGRELGIRPRGFAEVIRSGVDAEDFGGAIAARPTGPITRLGTVGRLADQKDPATLVTAFAEAHAVHPVISFRWIGDGPLREQVAQSVETRGLGSAFELAGASRNVPQDLASLDLFVLASKYEGLPRSLVEAALAGVPIVAVDVGGVGELIDPSTGWLVSPGDPPAMAAAIRDAIEHPDVAARRAAAARQRALSEFTSAEMCRRTAEVYERLCSPML
jgi:glycosyltransferase involved in cell wall biosynthesis